MEQSPMHGHVQDSNNKAWNDGYIAGKALSYSDGFEDGKKSVEKLQQPSLIHDTISNVVSAILSRVESMIQSEVINAINNHVAVSHTEDDDKLSRDDIKDIVDDKLSDYDPTEHTDFEDAVDRRIDNYDMSDAMSDAIDYDKIMQEIGRRISQS